MVIGSTSFPGMAGRLALALLLLALTLTAAAESRHCPQIDAIVDAADGTDFEMVCRVARKTADFMDAHGFEVDQQLNITICERIPTHSRPPEFGHFDTRGDSIVVLSYPACMKATEGRLIFGQKMNLALHYSFIAHEIAHAIANRNFRSGRPSVAAHEYIAYSVQLATMPKHLRQGILDRVLVGAFCREEEISELYLNLNPEYFAVKSYLHFVKPENGARFYRRLLSAGRNTDPGDR